MMKTVYFIFILLSTINIHSQMSFSDDELAGQITRVLIASYDKKPVDSSLEKIIHQAGKKSYIKLLGLWVKNRSRMSSINFEMEPAAQNITRIIEKNSSHEKALYFKQLFEKLMMISMENFQMYFNAVKESKRDVVLQDITCGYIDECLFNMKYYNIQACHKIQTQDDKQAIERVPCQN